ncbi:MAG: DUF2513 domain-containing protein [Hyphomicrobiales bacterium]
MKRDLDLIREILLKVESFEPERLSDIQTFEPDSFSGNSAQNVYHLNLLIGCGFVEEFGSRTLAQSIGVKGMSMAGHDFLDSIREPSIWQATKARLSAAGGWTLELVAAVAKEELKRRLLGAIDS